MIQNSVAEAFVKGQWNAISLMLVNGHVQPGPVGRLYGSTRRTQCFCSPNMETTVPFGHAISIRQLPFAVLPDNVFLKWVYTLEQAITLNARTDWQLNFRVSFPIPL